MMSIERRRQIFIRRSMAALVASGLIWIQGSPPPAAAEPGAAHHPPFVCAQVVLAVDASGSTGEGAFHRQIEALRAAFGSRRLYQAIQDCLPGSVAFAVTTWSGGAQHDVCLGWSVVTSQADGRQIARHLDRCRYFGGTTDIGLAVTHGLRVLERAPFVSYYRIVLLMTNGRTDRGAEERLAAARARAAAAGVTLSAYALLHHEPERSNPFYVPDAVELNRYAREHVSAGPRSFTAWSRPEADVENVLEALVEALRQEAS